MTADTLEMFQDLNLRTRSADVSIRDAILKHVKAPWLHDPKREEETSSLRFRGEDVIALIREPSNGIEESALMLWQEDDGFRVSNIVPIKIGELGITRYNAILQDFVERVAKAAAEDAAFVIDLTPAFQTLEAWVGEAVATKLRRFSGAANKSTGASHPMDQKRWFDFIIAAHKGNVTLDPSRLARWLSEIDGWPQDTAGALAIDYEFARDLLAKYDEEA